MDKNTNFIGIDISKNTIDVWLPAKGHFTLLNSKKGFKELLKLIETDDWCVMEATGSYYQQLALFLYENKVRVSVMNPLVIKRFIQMKLQRNKTDKSDARMIALYASEQPLKLWHPEPEYIKECKQLNTTIDIYRKQSTALKNKLHSIQSSGILRGEVVKSLKRQIKQLKKEVHSLEQQIEELIKNHESQMLTNISSIPGLERRQPCYLYQRQMPFPNLRITNK